MKQDDGLDSDTDWKHTMPSQLGAIFLSNSKRLWLFF